MKLTLDARYLRERPSGIGAYVAAVLRRLPPRWPGALSLWRHPQAPSWVTDDPRWSSAVVRAPANGPGTLCWPSALAPLDDTDVFHAPFNILGRGIGCATVVTVHDLMWLHSPALCEGLKLSTPFQWAFYRDGIVRALDEATRVVAISQATADDIVKHFPKCGPRLRVITHGVESVWAPPADPAGVRARVAGIVGFSAPYFVMVGQNAPYKNQAAVVRAFAALPRRLGLRLVLLQRLQSGGALPKLAKSLGIEDRVVWQSALSDDDTRSLVQSALALVQFSRAEGFGMPVIEAMAAGTPVIVSAIAVFAEITAGAALVAADEAALTRAMAELAGSPRLADELSARGLARAADFSWERSADLHAEVYAEAASSPRARRHA